MISSTNKDDLQPNNDIKGNIFTWVKHMVHKKNPLLYSNIIIKKT